MTPVPYIDAVARVLRLVAAARVVGALLVLGCVAWSCSGCGASALAVQARAATVATVALEGAHRLAMDVTEAVVGALLGGWTPAGIA